MPARSWYKTGISSELAKIYARLGQTKSAVEQYEQLHHASQQEDLPSMHQSMTASDSKVYFKRDAQAREEAQELQSSMSTFVFSVFSFGSLDEADTLATALIKVYRDAGKLKTLLAYIQKRSKTNPETRHSSKSSPTFITLAENDAKAAMYYQQVGELQPTNVRSFYYAAAHLNNSNQPETCASNAGQR